MAARGSGDSGALRELPLVLVLLLVAGGLGLGALSLWRTGAVLIGTAVLAAAALRLLLPARRAGLLVVRSRRLDVTVLLVLGAGLVALAWSVPTP